MASSKERELAIKIAGMIDPSFKHVMDESSGKLAKLGKAAKAAGAVAGAALLATGTAALAAGKYLYGLGTAFDGAYDAIRIGTGATGEALEGLKTSMNNVYASVPTTLEDAGQVIADYNTLLGVTGGTLEGLSTQAIQVADMLGEDLGSVVENSATAFSQWNIASENMGGAMDYVFKVAQSTGVGFSDLMGNLQSYGAALQGYGYSFEEAATLLGSVSKSGYDVSAVFAGLKTGAANLADEGFATLAEGMEVYVAKIQNASTETEALSIAADVFGSRAATTMTAAIRDGTLSVSDLQAALEASAESISGAAEDTYDFAERWQLMKQQLEVALQPAASELFDKLGDTLPALSAVAAELIPIVADLAGEFVGLVSDGIDSLLPAIEEIIPLLTSLAGEFVTSILPVISDLITMLLPTITSLLTTLIPVISQFVSTLLPPIVSILEQILPPLIEIMNAVLPVITTLIAAMAPVLSALLTALSPIFGVLTQLLPPITSLISLLTPIVTLVGQLAVSILTACGPAITVLADLFTTVLSGAISAVGPILEGLTTILQALIDFITNVFQGNWGDAWQAIVDLFGGIWETIEGLFKAPINAVITMLNWFISKINTISITLPNWSILGEYAGANIGFNIPQIEYLAEGGIVTDPTLSMIGEGGEPEAVMPLSKLAEMLDNMNPKPDNGGSGDEDYQVVYAPVMHFHGGTPSREDLDASNNASFEQFKAWYKRMKADERRKAFSPT